MPELALGRVALRGSGGRSDGLGLRLLLELDLCPAALLRLRLSALLLLPELRLVRVALCRRRGRRRGELHRPPFTLQFEGLAQELLRGSLGCGGDDVLLTADVDAGDVDWFSTFQASFSRPWELHVALTGEPRLQSIYEKDTGFRTEVEAASAPRMG